MSEYPASGKRDSAADDDNFLLMDSRCVVVYRSLLLHIRPLLTSLPPAQHADRLARRADIKQQGVAIKQQGERGERGYPPC